MTKLGPFGIPPIVPDPNNRSTRFTPTARVPAIKPASVSRPKLTASLEELIAAGLAIEPINPLGVADERGFRAPEIAFQPTALDALDESWGQYTANRHLQNPTLANVTAEDAKSLLDTYAAHVEAITQKLVGAGEGLAAAFESHYGFKNLLGVLKDKAQGKPTDPERLRSADTSVFRMGELCVILGHTPQDEAQHMSQVIDSFQLALHDKAQSKSSGVISGR